MSVEQWNPVGDLKGPFYLMSLVDNKDGLSLRLNGEGVDETIIIIFQNPFSYKNADEGKLLKSLRDGKIRGGFFKFRQSEYIDWLHEETFNQWKKNELVHYAIYTPNDCIDILSLNEPVVKVDK